MTHSAAFAQRNAIPVHLERETLKELSRPAPARLLLQLGVEWLSIVALVSAAGYFSHILTSIFCIVLIATRQHALLALMHEFSHYQFSRRRKWLNDMIGDVFTAIPFFITVHGFRRNHLPHHAHVATERDPNWVASLKKARYHFPKTRRQVLTEVLKHGAGLYTWDEMTRYTVNARMSVDLPAATRVRQIACALGVAVLATYFHLWQTILLYWLVPLGTFLMAILYVRDIGEHYGMQAPGILGSRTVCAGWLERLLFAQNGVNFHAEHHLFPSVPFFRLKRLHHHLLRDDYYRKHASVTEGYLSGLVDEVTRT